MKVNKKIPKTSEQLLLVDESDKVVGIAEKMEAHIKGMLHRAFSAVVLNSKGQILLQQRAPSKYHSGGLWSNTTCGHPLPRESTSEAAHRRLSEEMGIACHLEEVFAFRYSIQLDKGITENEYNHDLLGRCDNLLPKPHADEVSNWKWVNLKDLRVDIKNNPKNYTYWFKIVIEEMQKRNLA